MEAVFVAQVMYCINEQHYIMSSTYITFGLSGSRGAAWVAQCTGGATPIEWQFTFPDPTIFSGPLLHSATASTQTVHIWAPQYTGTPTHMRTHVRTNTHTHTHTYGWNCSDMA